MRHLTPELKEQILNVCHRIGNDPSLITEIIKQFGIGYNTLHRLVAADQDLSEAMADSKALRAWAYAEEASKIMDECEEFWTDHEGKLKERMCAFNKAKHRADHKMKMAATLAPEIFGDLRYELRSLQKAVDEIQKKLDNQSGSP